MRRLWRPFAAKGQREQWCLLDETQRGHYKLVLHAEACEAAEHHVGHLHCLRFNFSEYPNVRRIIPLYAQRRLLLCHLQMAVKHGAPFGFPPAGVDFCEKCRYLVGVLIPLPAKRFGACGVCGLCGLDQISADDQMLPQQLLKLAPPAARRRTVQRPWKTLRGFPAASR